MAKPETGPTHSDLTAERHPRIDHERDVVLALADPGHLDEKGVLQNPPIEK